MERVVTLADTDIELAGGRWVRKGLVWKWHPTPTCHCGQTITDGVCPDCLAWAQLIERAHNARTFREAA